MADDDSVDIGSVGHSHMVACFESVSNIPEL